MSKRVSATLALCLSLTACNVTTNPFTEAETEAYALDAAETAAPDQEPLSGPLTLYEAMARALKYNVDHRVEMMNASLGRANARIARAEMLPDLVASAGYLGRSDDGASYSRAFPTGARSVSATSSHRDGLSADLTFSWHVLDFGLSYIRAKQAADKALIAQERQRKIVQRIIADTRTAYWRAVSAERLLAGFDKLKGRVERALGNTRALAADGRSSPIAALTYERELVAIKERIIGLQGELKTARLQLASLVNIKPGTPYRLDVPPRRLPDLEFNVGREEITLLALKQRPELRQIGYEERINAEETRAALLELLPNLTGYAGLNADSNDLLVSSNWVSYGAKIGWNAMKVFKYPARKRGVEAKAELLDAQAKATAMAIMLQVEVARTRYALARQAAAAAAEYNGVQRKLLRRIEGSAKAGVASEQTLVREKMNALVAEARYDMAYAGLQNAFASLFASVGEAPYAQTISPDMPIAELTTVLRDTWRDRGDTHG